MQKMRKKTKENQRERPKKYFKLFQWALQNKWKCIRESKKRKNIYTWNINRSYKINKKVKDRNKIKKERQNKKPVDVYFYAQNILKLHGIKQ